MKKANIQQLPISGFDYSLPDIKIAKYPLPERDASKLLVYDGSRIRDDRFASLAEYLPENSLLVFNNTRVIHARLLFQKATGARVEVFCLAPHDPADYVVSFLQRERCSWKCMIGNARRWKEEELIMHIPMQGTNVTLSASKKDRIGNDTVVEFTWNDNRFSFSELLEAAGKLPIPPYLNRSAEKEDEKAYQTVYSRVEGSVAAPTAGLHFTPELMDIIHQKGVQSTDVTLHVGAGTFKPVKSETMASHEMHTEYFTVTRETIETLLNHSGKLIPVGTTSARTLESLYYIGKKLRGDSDVTSGKKLCVEQWEPYDEQDLIAPKQALEAILTYLAAKGEGSLSASTRLLIAPGYRFHFADALITNFHQPQSTLLLLVSAFIGDAWKDIYRHALENDFRFLSYGDSSLLWKNPK